MKNVHFIRKQALRAHTSKVILLKCEQTSGDLFVSMSMDQILFIYHISKQKDEQYLEPRAFIPVNVNAIDLLIVKQLIETVIINYLPRDNIQLTRMICVIFQNGRFIFIAAENCVLLKINLPKTSIPANDTYCLPNFEAAIEREQFVFDDKAEFSHIASTQENIVWISTSNGKLYGYDFISKQSTCIDNSGKVFDFVLWYVIFSSQL